MRQQVSIPQVRTFYSISLVPKIFEKNIKEYPTLIPTNIEHNNLPKLRFTKTSSSLTYVNELSENIGEQGHLQSPVETFIGQVVH